MNRPMAAMRTTRRRFLAGAGGLAGALALSSAPSTATPERMAEAIKKTTGGKTVQEGKVTIDVPPLVENGNAVPVRLTVESPMTETDHVRRIHLFNEKNPQPNVATFHLGPRAGRAHVTTRIRLADSQQVVCIAEMSDGSFWSASVDVIVTLAACLEENL
jgi:sulfur-oxidizing protein SoxY